MNILFITILLPFPIDSGAKYKTFNILRLISAINKIDFVSFIDDKNDVAYIHDLKKYCRSYKVFYSQIINLRHPFLLLKLITSILHIYPFIVLKYYSLQMKEYINLLIQQNKYDLIYVDHINMVQYIQSNYKGKIIYDEHNISSLAFSKFSRNENNLLLKIIYQYESFKLKLFEKKFLKKFNHIFTISDIDKKRLSDMGIPLSKLSYLPVPFLSKNSYRYRNEKQVIAFIGLLSWMPNLKGIIWFIENIYAHIKRSIPQVRLVIVGKNGNELMKYLKRIKDQSIIYEGFLHDIDRLYKKTSVVIIPIREGGGVRIKLLDALSHGMPVVSTDIGAEGIPVTPGRDLLLANDPLDFAEAVISVLKNREIAERLSVNGHKIVKSHYDEKISKKILDKVIKRLEEGH